MTRLVLARHSQSEYNAVGRFTGWANPPLTAEGMRQADALGSCLQRAGILPNAIYASPLQRAHSTAEIACRHLNMSPDAVVIAEALRERNVGLLTGMCKATARDLYGTEMISGWKTDAESEPLGGETIGQVGRRVHDFIYDHALYEKGDDEVILLISHSNAIKSFFKLAGIDIGFDNVSLPQDHAIMFKTGDKYPKPEFIGYGYS